MAQVNIVAKKSKRKREMCADAGETISLKLRMKPTFSDNNNLDPSNLREPSPTGFFTTSPAVLFPSRVDDVQMPLQGITPQAYSEVDAQISPDGTQKARKTRLLLDSRIELSDDELKVSRCVDFSVSFRLHCLNKNARASYLQGQEQLRRNHVQKHTEKESGRFLKERIWGVPTCSMTRHRLLKTPLMFHPVSAPALAAFWQEIFKLHVEFRTGLAPTDLIGMTFYLSPLLY
ncbi:hypothetical protein H0H93_002961 [Arthromyces matolae]|nr:hypothetical protein H0H93_002961 [Arthromyces matolae]